MRTVIASADRQGKPAVMHFGTPKKEAIQTGALNIDGHKLLDNVGGETFDYGSFKAAYDTDARVKTMTANFNKDAITLKTSKEYVNIISKLKITITNINKTNDV